LTASGRCLRSLYSEGQFIHAIPYRADAYGERTPLMHEIRAAGIDL
jgi:hypothetical protein